jgi:hypothetical protein
MATVTNASGVISFGALTANVNVSNSNPPAVILKGQGTAQWNITGTASPTTPGTNALTVQCVGQTAGVYVMNDLGYLGVGVATPAYAVDAAGDVNATGVYRIGGTQLAAAQVVNAVDKTATYSNPAWITALAWSKITGAPATGVSSVFTRTGAVVATTGDYTAAQVTNAVSTIGSYPDPAWISSLGWSKLTGVPANVMNAVSTLGSYADPAWITSLAYSKLTGAPAIPTVYWQPGSGGAIYYNGGNVGIGTASPQTKLDVAGLISGQAVQIIGSPGNMFKLWETTNNSVMTWNLNSNGLLQWLNWANAAVFALDINNGKLGIGTASPNAALDVNAAFPASGTVAATSFRVGSGSMAGTAGEDYPLGSFSCGGGNAQYLSVRAHQVYGGAAWTNLALGLSYDVDASIGAGGQIWFLTGHIGVGMNSPAYTLDVNGDINTHGAFRVNGTAIATGMTSLAVAVGGPIVNNVTTLGFSAGGGMSVTYTNSGAQTTVTYASTSDIRIKQNVTDLIGGVSIIERLRPVAFEYSGVCGHEKGQRAASVIAQELQKTLPDAVYTVATKLYPEDADPIDLMCIDPMQITAQLILAVQQLSKRLAALEAKKPD